MKYKGAYLKIMKQIKLSREIRQAFEEDTHRKGKRSHYSNDESFDRAVKIIEERGY